MVRHSDRKLHNFKQGTPCSPSEKTEKSGAFLLHCIAHASSLRPWHNTIQNGYQAFCDTL